MHVMELGGDGDSGRSWCLVLEQGEEVMERLEDFAGEQGVRGGHLKALGAFLESTLAFFDWKTKEYRKIPVDRQAEVTSLVGDVGRTEDGAVAVHVHCVLGLPDGSARTGHLLRGVVRPTLEVFLEEGGAQLTRRPDPESGLDLIRP